ncbi:MAG: hypothetical protein AB1801_24775, partial [Chloroflexota bacterium]
MTKFFLSTQSQVLANDFYHYTVTSTVGTYEQRKIMADGEPDHNPQIIKVYDAHSQPIIKAWTPGQQIGLSHWLEIPAPGPPTYLGFRPAGNTPPQYIWRNVLLHSAAL